MSCQALTNKGGKLYISEDPVDCDLTLSELAVLDYLFVPGVGSIGDTGIEQGVVTYPVTDAGLTPQGKGDATARNWDIEILDAQSVARDILDEASAVGNNDNYATRIEWPNGDVEFSIVQVASRTAVKGAASGVRVIRYTMIPSFIPIVTNSLPVASNVKVTGIMSVGYTLTGTYDYYSPLGLPESGSDYQWYASALPDGAGTTPILGAGAITFEIPPEYADMHLSFQVIPSDGMNDGAAVMSPADGPVVSETPLDLFVDGADGFWLDPSDFGSLWVDQAKTTHPTLPGDVVWWIDDKSPNQNHFAAPSSAARGRLYRWPASAVLEGYPRNRIIYTDDLQSWTAGLGEVSVTSGVTDPDGGATAFAVTWVSGEGRLSNNSETLTVGDTVTMSVWARSDSPSATIRLFTGGSGSSSIAISNEWALYLYTKVVVSTSPGVTQLRVSTGDVVEFWKPQVEYGEARTSYQRVGSGIWDVTEEGQADCWGVAFDGVTTRYLSARGIPLFVEDKLRMLVGQTNLIDAPPFAHILTNSDATIGENNTAHLFAHNSTDSYFARYRSTDTVTVGTGLNYPAPHSATLDLAIEGNTVSAELQVNSDPAITGSASISGTINAGTWSLGSSRSGTNLYNGIIWGTILVAEEPDTDTWEVGARQWMSNHNMGGILND